MFIIFLFAIGTYSIPLHLVNQIPNNLTVEWFHFDSHLGLSESYSTENPTALFIPSPPWAVSAWIQIKSQTKAIKFDTPQFVGRRTVFLRFGWWGPNWSLGIAFERNEGEAEEGAEEGANLRAEI